MWLHSLKVAQLLRSAACLHTNQSRSYLNHLVHRSFQIRIHNQIKPVRELPSYSLRPTLILSSHLLLGLPNDLLHSGFPTKTLYAFLFSPTCATCHAHLILLHLTTSIIFVAEHKSLSSSLCSLLLPPVTASQA